MQISGLASGIDTSAMVDQLMSLERRAGTQYTTGRNLAQQRVMAFTSLNSKFKAIADAAAKFVPTSITQTPVWNSISATTSNKDVATATATDKAQAGTLTFTVKSIAQASASLGGKEFSVDTVANSANGGAAFDFNIKVGDDPTKDPINVKVGPDAKLADVVAAINQQAGAEVKATMVQVATGTYKLQLTSVQTGSNTGINVTNGSTPPVVADVLGEFTQVAEGKDTVLHIGDTPDPNAQTATTAGYDVTSTTREVKDLLPGVTISPVKADPNTQVTIDLKTNVDDMASKVEEMIKAANEALSNIKTNSVYDREKPANSGPFVGDSTTRDLKYKLLGAVAGSSTASPNLAGISVDKSGTITFDKAKFTAEYAKDPSKVQAAVNGVATGLGQIAKDASDSTKGSISMRIKGEQDSVKNYSDQIQRFETRMQAREATLMAQFKGLESMMQKMQSQGNWLAGQLAALPMG